MTNLNFKAILDSTDFNNKLNQMNARLQETQSKAAEAGKKFAALSAIIVGVGTALGALTVANARAATELRRQAQISNTNVKEFQRLAYAASTVGIEQDKLADILKDVNDRVGDFIQTGGGPMADFFEKIAPKVGVTADEFKNLSGPEALLLYVDSLQKAGLSQQEMTFYLEAMGSDLTWMLPLLKNNGEELRKLTAEYDKLGIALSKTELDKLAALNAKFLLIGDAIAGIGAEFALNAAPALNAMADAFLRLVQEGSILRESLTFIAENLGRLAAYAGAVVAFFGVQWVAGMAAAAGATGILSGALALLRLAIARTGLGVLIIAAGELFYQFLKLVDMTGGFGNAIAALGDVAVEVWGRIKEGASLMGEALAGVALSISAEFQSTWVSVLEGFTGLLSRIQGGINNIKAAFSEAFTFEVKNPLTGGTLFSSTLDLEESTFADRYSEMVGGMRDAADQATENARIYNESIRSSADALLRPLESMQALRDATSDAAKEGTKLNAVYGGAGPGTPPGGGAGGGGKAGKTVKEQTADNPITKWVESMKQGVEQIGTMISNTYNKLEDALVDFVKTGKLDFSSLIDSMISDLIRFSLRSMFFGTQGGGGGLFGGLLSLLGGGGGLFGGASWSRNGNAFGSSGQLNFASGGVFNQKFAMPMANGRMAIGAEAGPEAIMPLQRGSDGRLGVVATSSEGSGGQTIVNNFNTTINPGNQTSPQDARKFAAEFNRAVEAKVLETMAKRQNTGVGGRR